MGTNEKSPVITGVLALTIGSLGIHNFYRGDSNKGLAQLLLTTVGAIFFGIGPIIAFIWATVEGIEVLTANANRNTGGTQTKSCLAAAILSFTLGAFGVGSFYLGETGKAVGKLLLTLLGWCVFGLGPLAAIIWSIVDGVNLLNGKTQVDGTGKPLGE